MRINHPLAIKSILHFSSFLQPILRCLILLSCNALIFNVLNGFNICEVYRIIDFQFYVIELSFVPIDLYAHVCVAKVYTFCEINKWRYLNGFLSPRRL